MRLIGLFGLPCSALASLGVCGRRTQDAELVAFRVGEHDPRYGPLAHVRGPGTQTDQSLHLGIVGAVYGPQVEMQAILDRLAFGNSDKDKRRNAASPSDLFGQVSRLLLPSRDLDLSLLGAYDVIPKRRGPERRLRDRVAAIDNDLGESEHYRIYQVRAGLAPFMATA